MNQKVKVSFYHKRNEEKEDGSCPVMARLTVGATEAVFSAKLNASANLWASGRAKGKGKAFRSQLRGLTDIPFFIFRLAKLFA